MSEYYAIIQNTESEEYHIQKYEEKVNIYGNKKFIPISNCSECGMNVDRKFTIPLLYKKEDGNAYTYFLENSMRHICAEIGRQVCGRCVATLYASQDEYGNWLF